MSLPYVKLVVIFKIYIVNVLIILACKSNEKEGIMIFDPLGRPTVRAGSDHYFRTCFRRKSVITFQSIAKQNKRRLKIMIANGGTVGLDEGIIDDTCLVLFYNNPSWEKH